MHITQKAQDCHKQHIIIKVESTLKYNSSALLGGTQLSTDITMHRLGFKLPVPNCRGDAS